MATQSCDPLQFRLDSDLNLEELVQSAWDVCEANTEEDVDNDLNSVSAADGGVPVYPKVSPDESGLTEDDPDNAGPEVLTKLREIEISLGGSHCVVMANTTLAGIPSTSGRNQNQKRKRKRAAAKEKEKENSGNIRRKTAMRSAIPSTVPLKQFSVSADELTGSPMPRKSHPLTLDAALAEGYRLIPWDGKCVLAPLSVHNDSYGEI